MLAGAQQSWSIGPRPRSARIGDRTKTGLRQTARGALHSGGTILRTTRARLQGAEDFREHRAVKGDIVVAHASVASMRSSFISLPSIRSTSTPRQELQTGADNGVDKSTPRDVEARGMVAATPQVCSKTTLAGRWQLARVQETTAGATAPSDRPHVVAERTPTAMRPILQRHVSVDDEVSPRGRRGGRPTSPTRRTPQRNKSAALTGLRSDASSEAAFRCRAAGDPYLDTTF